MTDADRKRQLLVELARARSAISRAGGNVREGLDFGSRVKRSVKESPAWWIGGAVAGVGLVFLVARARRPVVVVRGNGKASSPSAAEDMAEPVAAGAALGVLTTVGRWLVPVLRPLVVSFVAQKAAEWFGKDEGQS